ncbi:MAG: TrmH family RNA methyltransferase [Terriglobales bacterium]
MPRPAEFDGLRVVLVAPRNPLNIGAAARAMSNFGFFCLRVVNPYEVAFREARSAVGATAVLANAEEYGTVAEAVSDCTLVVGTTAAHGRELPHPLRRLQEGARLIRPRLKSGSVALLFGSEKRGLSNQDFSYCHWLMRIPTRDEHGSMNLGQAVAVCLYELARAAKGSVRREKVDLATGAQLELLYQALAETLTVSGYGKRGSGISTEQRLRRMIRQLNLPAHDAEMWLGILRQILWKIRSGQPPISNHG